MYRSSLVLIIMLAITVGCAKKNLQQEQVAEPTVVNEAEVAPVVETVKAPVEVKQKVEVNTFRLDASALKAVFFAYDSYGLSTEAKESLKSNAELLKFDPEFSVTIEGHCDERGSDEYNMSLGERRAQAVMSYLASLGVDQSRLTTISYGEERPVVHASNEISWAKNRRVEFN